MSETTKGADVRIIPCPCGSEHCRDWHLLGIGKFVQGSGFTREEAERIVAALSPTSAPPEEATSQSPRNETQIASSPEEAGSGLREYERAKLAYTQAIHGRLLWEFYRSDEEVAIGEVEAAEKALDAAVARLATPAGSGEGEDGEPAGLMATASELALIAKRAGAHIGTAEAQAILDVLDRLHSQPLVEALEALEGGLQYAITEQREKEARQEYEEKLKHGYAADLLDDVLRDFRAALSRARQEGSDG